MPKANEIHTIDDFICASQTQKDSCLKLEYFPGHIAEIGQQTRGQATNPIWFAVRRHLITASKAHDFKTSRTTLKRAPQGKGIDFKNLIDKIAGRKSVNPLLPPLRYGQTMESNAVQMFLNLYKEKLQNAKGINQDLMPSLEK